MPGVPKKTSPRFDDSLSKSVQAVIDVLGQEAFEKGKVIRDPYGRLGFISASVLTKKISQSLTKKLNDELGHYASNLTLLVTPDDFSHSALSNAPVTWRLIESASGDPIWVDVVDRRIIGQDWGEVPPEEPEPLPIRLAFASMKGGVGRSTALCVLAKDLAQAGFNVLAIDADLEAPGLGALMLRSQERPVFGLLDYLVENGIGGWKEDEYEQFVASSDLADRSAGQGLIDIVPAIGRRTLEQPVEMLSKLSRAMLEDPSELGEPKSVRSQLREFVDKISSRRKYDAVLLDTRAGFSEAAAAVLLGLGAKVLFFGVNQSQTFEDFKFLLAHLAHLPAPVQRQYDWRHRIRFVHSKADPQGDDIPVFRDRLYEVVSEQFYEDEASSDQPFVYSLDDRQAPHSALVINFDFPYMRFDPLDHPGQLKNETYQAAFEGFLKEARLMLGLSHLDEASI